MTATALHPRANQATDHTPDETRRSGWFNARIALALSPLLVFYLAVIFLASPDSFVADEGRYLKFAAKLAQGTYALPGQEFLWNGPGYPLVLAAAQAVGISPEAARFLNAGFLYIAVVLFSFLIQLEVGRRWALGSAWVFGLYMPFYQSLPLLHTELFTVALVCALFYCLALARHHQSRSTLCVAGVFLGYLALTRILFGYILLVGLLLTAIWLGRRPRSAEARRLMIVHVLALATTTPYLAYTYRLTGQPFYWGNSGGSSLYAMSTPFAEEWGDWFGPAQVREIPQFGRHTAFFDSVATLPPVEQDRRMRQRALQNIREHPAKFAENVAANLSRLFFSFPFSYTPQKLRVLFYVVPNGLLLIATLVAGLALVASRPAGFIGWLPHVAFITLTLLATAPLSAYARMLFPIVPSFFYLVVHGAHQIMRARPSTWLRPVQIGRAA
jgi:4-amino-4-deoxy-L-arabinose transferase-like glycosyltransferase